MEKGVGRVTYNKERAESLGALQRCIDSGSPRISGNNRHMRREKGKEKKHKKQKKKKRKIPEEKQERGGRRRIKQELCLNYARRNNLQSARSVALWDKMKQKQTQGQLYIYFTFQLFSFHCAIDLQNR